MKQTRLANKATEAFMAAHGGKLPDRTWSSDLRWLDGWKRGYRLGRQDQKRSSAQQHSGEVGK